MISAGIVGNKRTHVK